MKQHELQAALPEAKRMRVLDLLLRALRRFVERIGRWLWSIAARFVAASATGSPPEMIRISVSGAPANGESQAILGCISSDGRYVAFWSFATNLVAEDLQGRSGCFLRDRQQCRTTHLTAEGASADPVTGTWAPCISSDGRFVAFQVALPDLFSAGDPPLWRQAVYVRDRQTGDLQRVDVSTAGVGGDQTVYEHQISANGRHVVFSTAASNLLDGQDPQSGGVYVRDLQAGTTTRVDVTGDVAWIGMSNGATISGDGRYVALQSVGGTPTMVLWPTLYVRDMETGAKTQVDVSTAGTPANQPSMSPRISDDGRFVAFRSGATNLIDDQTSNRFGIYVRDLQAGATSRVDLNSSGVPADAFSSAPVISADGRWVAFASTASNLAPGGSNGTSDAYLHDRQTGVTSRINTNALDQPADHSTVPVAITPDGRYIVLTSSATNIDGVIKNAAPDVFVRDMVDGVTQLISVSLNEQAQFGGYGAVSMSGDGRYVAFTSPSRNLVPVPGPASPPNVDVFPTVPEQVFVRDTFNCVTTCVSVNAQGELADATCWYPSVSADGRFVVFWSSASNLAPGLNSDFGRVFLHDRWTRRTSLISVATDGTPANNSSSDPSISANGRWVAFVSSANNLDARHSAWTDIYLRDLEAGTTTLVSLNGTDGPSDGSSLAPGVSGDGRFVAFGSGATNLVPGDTNDRSDNFVRDMQTETTTRVSVATGGAQASHPPEVGGGGMNATRLSADGRYVAFVARHIDLVEGDTNGTLDIFVHDRVGATTTRISVASDGTQAHSFSNQPSISGDGRFVAFGSGATNLAQNGDTNTAVDVFLHDRNTGATRRLSVAFDGNETDGSSFDSAVSEDGRYVAFNSFATNLLPEPSNGRLHIYRCGPLSSP